MATVLATAELERMEPRAALTRSAETITGRACDPDAAALFRIVATEAQRFPELAAKMREKHQALRRQRRRQLFSHSDSHAASWRWRIRIERRRCSCK